MLSHHIFSPSITIEKKASSLVSLPEGHVYVTEKADRQSLIFFVTDMAEMAGHMLDPAALVADMAVPWVVADIMVAAADMVDIHGGYKR